MKNTPYRKTVDNNGKVTDNFPYNSGTSQRRINRGSEKLSINNLGEVRLMRRVKSSKRKKDWI